MLHPLAKVKNENNRSIGFMVYNSEKDKSEFMSFNDMRLNRNNLVGLLSTPKSIVLNQYYRNIGILSDDKELIVPSFTCIKRVFSHEDTKYVIVSHVGEKEELSLFELKLLIEEGIRIAGVLIQNDKIKFSSGVESACE